MSKNQEKIKAALNRIEDSLAAINTDEDWLKFLSFQAQFYNYSFGNAMLIFSQNPNATYVKGYKAWNQLGRYVKKGSKGLAILAPCIRKVEVFKEPENKNLYHDEEAEKEIKRINKLRENHYNYYTDNEWKNPDNYDLCVNSDTLGVEKTADLICNMVETIKEPIK